MSGPFGSSQWMYASGGFYPYQIEQSLRFNDDDSAYLSRTPASAGNRKTWTWSGWVKRGNIVDNTFVSLGTTLGVNLRFSSNALQSNILTVGSTTSTAVYRDPSAWYHIVMALDTTQALNADRLKLYVNGYEVSYSANATITQNSDLGANSATFHAIGVEARLGAATGGTYLDGYLAEVNFIDGQALDPTSFGETKSGIWVPKAYSGAYGTNGFYLSFADSAAIGDDLSGNGNDWTANNLVSTDVLLDSPTQNWATLNPLNARFSSASTQEGNLRWVKNTSSDFAIIYGGFGMSSGKWYMEVDVKSRANYFNISVANGSGGPNTDADNNLSRYRLDVGYLQKRVNATSSTIQVTGASTSAGIIGIAFDVDAGTCAWYHNNTLQGTVTGLTTDETYFLQIYGDGDSNNANVYINHGQDSSFAGTRTAQGNTDDNGVGDFYYAPPSGYLALCTANLPDPVIDPAQDDVPADYFNTVLYTGNGSTQSISVGWQPDFVWLKRRDSAGNHFLLDAVRGATKQLYSDLTLAEETRDSITSFTSTGYDLGNYVGSNGSSYSMTSWNWLAGNGTASNTDGSITSTVSVNQKAGFSVVGWTGNGVTNATIGHSLGVKPDTIIAKSRSVAGDWRVWHNGLSGAGYYLTLNQTVAEGSSTSVWGTSPAQNATTFTIGTNSDVNTSGEDYIAYCFAEVEGYSKFGSYTGNGSAGGPFVYCGFRPAWVLWKSTSAAYDWDIYDAVRDTYNAADARLKANSSDAEATLSPPTFDILSNGFKLRHNYNSSNASGVSYIFMAFAESPFKYANAR